MIMSKLFVRSRILIQWEFTRGLITVAPAMTLSDTTFQRMRDMAIHMMRSIGEFAGGCNVQFAVSPDEKEDIMLLRLIQG